MRPGLAVVLPLLLLSACRTQDVAPPELRRPIEALPAGARAVVLASDLQNTWQHVEALQLGKIVAEWPMLGEACRDSDIVRLRAAYRDLEQRAGLNLENDVLLNVAGGRAALGLYATPGGTHDQDLLLVAELRDPERFRAALTALRGQSIPDWSFEDTTWEGEPALRLQPRDGRGLLLVQRQALLVASTRDDLVRSGLALHTAGGEAGALREPALAAALGAVGPHNVVMLAHSPADDAKWMAQGFTWDRAGLHFESVHTADAPRAALAPTQRAKILGSIPDGMTMACYLHAPGLDLRNLLEDCGLGRRAQAESGADATAASLAANAVGALPFVPAGVLDWAGDEIAVALLGVEPTPLAPIPNVAIVLEVRDAAAAARGLQDLEAELGNLPVGPAARGFVDANYGGKTYRTFVQPLSENVSPSYLLDGDVAVVTTTRALMHQIIDTRRTGRRSLLTDGAFARFARFVPQDAQAVAYADQKRLHAAAAELGHSVSMWGPQVAHGVTELERVSALLEHFPAGAAYMQRDADRVTLHGWMLEDTH